jgi:osmoprotectant transport system permease protein
MSGSLAFLSERRAELLLLTGQHVVLVLLSTATAVAIALPLGVWLTRNPRLARPVLALAGIVQTIPSLALFGFLVPLPFVGGIGARTAVVALVLYALLPILRNTHAGILQVDPAVREAATGLGMTDGQRLRQVELPLALPVILAGIRVAAVIGVGTATIAAAVGAGGLGTLVFRGIATLDTRLILAGAVPAALLALLVDALLAGVEKSARPARAAAALTAATIVVLGVAGLLARTPAAARRPLVVCSKNFTEQVILGEMVAAVLESRGLAVDRRLNLGGTQLCHEAVRRGDCAVYVEYSGTALVDILKKPARSDRHQVVEEVRAAYTDLGLAVGAPLGFNNTFALVTRPETAQTLGLRRLSDISRHARTLRVGLFGEFLERPDGLPGLSRTYGFALGVAPREMDLGLLYQALLADQVDVVVGSATDGLIAAHDLVVLEDDRGYFPPYDAIPVLGLESSRRHPELAPALASLAGRIDEGAMRRLNLAVDGAHQDPRAVASAFLREAGLTTR